MAKSYPYAPTNQRLGGSSAGADRGSPYATNTRNITAKPDHATRGAVSPVGGATATKRQVLVGGSGRMGGAEPIGKPGEGRVGGLTAGMATKPGRGR